MSSADSIQNKASCCCVGRCSTSKTIFSSLNTAELTSVTKDGTTKTFAAVYNLQLVAQPPENNRPDPTPLAMEPLPCMNVISCHDCGAHETWRTCAALKTVTYRLCRTWSSVDKIHMLRFNEHTTHSCTQLQRSSRYTCSLHAWLKPD